MASLEERIKENLKAFEEIERQNEAYQREKEELLAKAKELGINLEMKIPWDQLTEEQRLELQRIKDEGEREFREAMNVKEKSTVKKSLRWMRI